MFRVMLILGLLVLVPAAIMFWRGRDRTGVSSSPSAPPSRVIGTSTLSHGGMDVPGRPGGSPTLPERNP